MNARGESGGHTKSIRTFFALWPDAPARARLAAIAADVARAAGGRAVAAANLHVTLAFVGSVAPARIDELRDAGAEAARDAVAFDVVLERVGSAHDGELAWLAPTALARDLASLRARLDTALEQRGFAIERRPFRPHVTLARRCIRRADRHDVEAVAWRAPAFALLASTTRADGAEYRELASWPLAAQ